MLILLLFTLLCLIGVSLAQNTNNTISYIYSTQSSIDCYYDTLTNKYCSGNGECVINIEYSIYNNNNSIVNNSLKINTDGYCLCNQGWNGKTDFINKNGKDCRNHQLTIIIFMTINAAMCVIWLIILGLKWYKVIKKQNDNEISLGNSNSNGSLSKLMKRFSNIPSGAKVCMVFSIERSLGIAICLLHLNNERVFNTLTITILYIIETYLFWCAATYTAYIFLKLNLSLCGIGENTLVQSQKILKLVVRLFKLLVLVILPLQSIWMGCAYINRNTEYYQTIFTQLYFLF